MHVCVYTILCASTAFTIHLAGCIAVNPGQDAIFTASTHCSRESVLTMGYRGSTNFCMYENFTIVRRFYFCDRTPTPLVREQRATTYCDLIFATTSLLAKFAKIEYTQKCVELR